MIKVQNNLIDSPLKIITLSNNQKIPFIRQQFPQINNKDLLIIPAYFRSINIPKKFSLSKFYKLKLICDNLKNPAPGGTGHIKD